MSEGKHTKGPWLFDGQCITTESGLSVIATVERDQGAGQEATDNARLIAAAPELLEACKAVVAALTQPVQYTKIRNGASCDVLRADCATAANFARAAIAKAEKGQP